MLIKCIVLYCILRVPNGKSILGVKNGQFIILVIPVFKHVMVLFKLFVNREGSECTSQMEK